MKKHLRSGLWVAAVVLTSCSKSDEPVQGTYQLNTNSIIEWKGTMPTGGFNNGSFHITENHIDVVNGQVNGGYFLFPIATLENFNLTDIGEKTQFLTHLKSVDFFNLLVYPEASFVITKLQTYTGGVPGAVANANFTVAGNFNMLGKSLPVSFPAYINAGKDSVSVKASFAIDRTRWGMNYAANPGPGLVIDKDVQIHFELAGARK